MPSSLNDAIRTLDDAGQEIERLRAVVRVNGLRWGHSHAEIDTLLAITPAECTTTENKG
jgi:hypothetical protein